MAKSVQKRRKSIELCHKNPKKCHSSYGLIKDTSLALRAGLRHIYKASLALSKLYEIRSNRRLPPRLHSILKRRKQLPPDWQLTQCLFGEHLLPQYLVLATGGNTTPADRAAHIDLADWIIQFLTNNK